MRLTPSIVIVLMTVLALLVDGGVSAPRRKYKHRGKRRALSKIGKAIEVISNTAAVVAAGYGVYEIFADTEEPEPEKKEIASAARAGAAFGYTTHKIFAYKAQPVSDKTEPKPTNRVPTNNLNESKHDSSPSSLSSSSSAGIHPLPKNGISGITVGLPTIFITVLHLFYILNT